MSDFQTAIKDLYRLERELGAGGMATVYLAHDLRHDRQVAIKLLHPELAAALGSERFLTEIRTTARLNHPHILPLLDSGAAGSLLWYVMPFVSGESLRSRITRERQLPVSDAVRIAREVADALGHAHAQGIVHRDIKPENILLQDDHALVADFGIALAVQHAGGQRLTQTGLSLGTPQYMSPEQAMGERSVDHRSDIYALGAVTYEMLAGEPPFTGPTVQAILAKLIADEPRALGTLRRSVPPEVESAVMHALEKLPADRIGTARDFTGAIAGNGAISRPVTAGQRRATMGGPRIAPVTVALAATTLASLLLAGWLWRRPQPEPARGVIQFAADTPDGAVVAGPGLTGANVAITPDGRTVAFVATGRDGTRRIVLRDVGDVVSRVLPGTEGGAQPFFSPDGGSIGFLAAGRLQIMRLDDPSPRSIAEIPDFFGATWVSQDQIIFSNGARLFSLSPAGGGPREVSRPDASRGEGDQVNPATLGDGEHIAYGSWSGGGTESVRIAILSLRTLRSEVLNVTAVMPLGLVDGHLIAVTNTGNVIAVPLDLAKARATGPAVTTGTSVIVGSGGGAKAAVSRSGSLAYLSGSPESELVEVDPSGSSRTILAERRAYGFPRYAPDGRRIALSMATGNTRDIWIFDAASRGLDRLSRGGTTNERPEWTPDGTRVVFRTDRGNRSSIWWQHADLSSPALPLVQSDLTPYFEAVITPDGKAVVYQVDTSGADIEYRMLEGDTTPRPVLNTPALENAMRLSPDGKWLAYVTDEPGSQQVRVQPFPGPGPRVQVSTEGGTEPVWSRDGRRLYYRGNSKLMAAEVTLNPTFAVTSRRPVLDDIYVVATAPHANYDVSPDGHLLMLRGLDTQRLLIVANWREQLRQRVAGLDRQ